MAASKTVRKLLRELPTNWDMIALEHYAVGASDQEVCRELEISMTLFRRMYVEDVYFKEIIDDGRGYSQAWWYKQGRDNLGNKGFNYNGWFQNMKNRYGWADKTETSEAGSKSLEQKTDEELTKDVEALLARHQKQGTDGA